MMPDIFNAVAALEFPSLPAKPDDSAELQTERGVLMPPWLPGQLVAAIKALPDEACRQLCIRQHAEIRASIGAPEGDGPPTDEQVQRWIQRENQKLRLASTPSPPLACLEGDWAYGLRPDGEISYYSFVRQSSGGGYDYVEIKQAGGELRGAVVDAASVALRYKPPGNFPAQWHTDLGEGNGMVWLRLHDAGTIHSVFQGPGAPGGFRAIARRRWATCAVTGDAEEEMLTGPLQRDAETGLIVPPWTPKEAIQQMMQQPLQRRQFFKTQQDMVLRGALNLGPEVEINEEFQRKWLRAAMNESKRRPVAFDGPPRELSKGDPLRFKAGDKVLCRIPTGWKSATVVKLWWPMSGQQGVYAPYQLRLDDVQGDMGLIFSPYDDDRFVTALPTAEPKDLTARPADDNPKANRSRTHYTKHCVGRMRVRVESRLQ